VRPVAPHVTLENTTTNTAKEVSTVAKHVGLENTVQLVRTVVTILQLRVPPVLMPSERTNVSNVTLENTTTKPARQVQQVAPTVLLEHTVQLVRPVAPHVTLECTPNYLVSMT
jgi:hypothetical protein